MRKLNKYHMADVPPTHFLTTSLLKKIVVTENIESCQVKGLIIWLKLIDNNNHYEIIQHIYLNGYYQHIYWSIELDTHSIIKRWVTEKYQMYINMHYTFVYLVYILTYPTQNNTKFNVRDTLPLCISVYRKSNHLLNTSPIRSL